MKYILPSEFPIVMDNRSNYNFHFIVKHLADKLEIGDFGDFSFFVRNCWQIQRKCAYFASIVKNVKKKKDGKTIKKINKTYS